MSDDWARALTALLQTDERGIIIVGGGAHAADMQTVRAAHPNRVIACGGGEHTPVLVAAGLAAEAWRPVILLDARRQTGRATALFDTLAAQDMQPGTLILHGPLPPGVTPPRTCPCHAVPDPAAIPAQVAADAGPQVWHVDAAEPG